MPAPAKIPSTVTEAVQSRRTWRGFLDKPVPLSLLEDLMENAARAPSGGNTQPWHVYVLTGDKLKELKDAAMKQMSDRKVKIVLDYNVYPKKEDMTPELFSAYMDRRVKCANDLWTLMGVKREDKAGRANALQQNFLFWGAPVGVIITVDRCDDRNSWGHTGMLMQTIALLAEERGLATNMLEAWGNLGPCVYETLKINKETEVVWSGMSIGYPDHDAAVNTLRTEREPLSKFCRFDGFETSKL